MIYKVVEGPKVVEGNACSYFENIINAQAQEGWRYHSMETIRETHKGGCFKKPADYTIYMLIFERDE